MDLSQAIHLSSSDVTNALAGFFTIGPVLAVLAMLLALLFVPLVVRAVRSVLNRGWLYANLDNLSDEAPGDPPMEAPMTEDEFYQSLL